MKSGTKKSWQVPAQLRLVFEGEEFSSAIVRISIQKMYSYRFVRVILAQGHANLLRIVPILTDDPRRESRKIFLRIGQRRKEGWHHYHAMLKSAKRFLHGLLRWCHFEECGKNFAWPAPLHGLLLWLCWCHFKECEKSFAGLAPLVPFRRWLAPSASVPFQRVRKRPRPELHQAFEVAAAVWSLKSQPRPEPSEIVRSGL